MDMTTTTYSPASELVAWTRNREDDIEQAYLMLKYVRMYSKPADRIKALRSLHLAISAVRIDSEVITRVVDEMSMCPCGLPTSKCVCVAPF